MLYRRTLTFISPSFSCKLSIFSYFPIALYLISPLYFSYVLLYSSLSFLKTFNSLFCVRDSSVLHSLLESHVTVLLLFSLFDISFLFPSFFSFFLFLPFPHFLYFPVPCMASTLSGIFLCFPWAFLFDYGWFPPSFSFAYALFSCHLPLCRLIHQPPQNYPLFVSSSPSLFTYLVSVEPPPLSLF